MQARITSNVRRAARWTLLPAVATAAVLALLPSALADDQQATTAEMDNAQNWEAAKGAGPRAQSFENFRHSEPAVDDRQETPAEMDDDENWDAVGGRANFDKQPDNR